MSDTNFYILLSILISVNVFLDLLKIFLYFKNKKNIEDKEKEMFIKLADAIPVNGYVFKPIDPFYGKHGRLKIETNTYIDDNDGEEMSDKLYRLKPAKIREYIQKPIVNQTITDLIKEDGEMMFPVVHEAIETYLVNYTGETISNASMLNYLKRSFENMLIEQFKQNPDILSSEVEILNDDSNIDDAEIPEEGGELGFDTEENQEDIDDFDNTDNEMNTTPEEISINKPNTKNRRKLR